MSRTKTGKEGQKSMETCGYLMTGIDFNGKKQECVQGLRELIENGSMTRFDLAVMTAMYGLWKEKTERGYDTCSMTYQQIYRTMNGISGMRHVRSATTENIRRSVEKMSCTKIFLETTDEEDLVSIIPCDEVYHGHNIAGITLLQCPVLCRYAETAGHMKEVPGDLWSIKSGSGKQMCTLERSIAFRDTLTECVITKKCRNGKNFRIGLKEITENAGLPFESLERKRRQRDRKLIETILDHFVQTGYLKGFTINTEEKTVEFQV